MANINGTIDWGIQPIDWDSSALALMSYVYRNNDIISANEPMRYQVVWHKIGLTEAHEPVKDNWNTTNETGDVLSIIFNVYATTEHPLPPIADWDKVASIKKSRDIANRHYSNGSPAASHRFTVDISQICADLLSYSLVPIGKGTWQNSEWGGMNGGATIQDNVTQSISRFNFSKNETYRRIVVIPEAEVVDGSGNIVSVKDPSGSTDSNTITAINSVNQFERERTRAYSKYYIYRWDSNNTDRPKEFLTRQPYLSHISGASNGHKTVRADEEAEWLYWYQGQTKYGDSISSDAILDKYALQVYVEGVDSVYLHEFSSTLDKGINSGVANTFNSTQNRICVQNVSVSYINANDGTNYTNAKTMDGSNILVSSFPNGIINSTNRNYRVNIRGRRATDTSVHYRFSGMMWYRLDVESEHPYGYVRFHWLNRLGGIDSYTAKRDIVEGLSVSRDTIERNSGDRMWQQADRNAASNHSLSAYYNDSMRGGDIYKGGREVLNVNAERNHSVYTEPLNRGTAEWLEELITSPNVWIEMDTEATKDGNDRNPLLRPSTKGYIPVIITNSDIEMVNQEEGLSKFNIEYTFAHKVQTQRN